MASKKHRTLRTRDLDDFTKLFLEKSLNWESRDLVNFGIIRIYNSAPW